MNQLLSREEVAALLQGAADVESERLEPGQVKKPKAPDGPYQTRTNRRVRRPYLLDSPR